MQHPKCCTKNLTAFKFDPTSSNMLQHIATYCNRVAKRMQHVVPNNFARCCVEMLRAFGQAFIRFNEHVTQTVSKCIAIALNRKTLTIIINALVFSRLLYYSSVWDCTSKKNISKLQKVQNFGERIITSLIKEIRPYLTNF